MDKYDSTVDTKMHIQALQRYMSGAILRLADRRHNHDASKLESPEKETFDEFTPKLKDSTYGSDEYKGFLNEMGVALDHHYEHNSHHPEHFENGINGMSLLDLLEMICDWKAATMRHADGDIAASLEINRKRFAISDQLFEILKNTVIEMEWDNG